LTKLAELLDMKVGDVLERYVQIFNGECCFLYGIAELDDVERLYHEYNIKEEYPEAFIMENLIDDKLNIYSEDAEVMSYEKLEVLMKNLGIRKKPIGCGKR